MLKFWTCSVETAKRKDFQTWASRGSKSRNKVSVGEPAEGSLTVDFLLVRNVYCKPWDKTLGAWPVCLALLRSVEWCRNSSSSLCSPVAFAYRYSALLTQLGDKDFGLNCIRISTCLLRFFAHPVMGCEPFSTVFSLLSRNACNLVK